MERLVDRFLRDEILAFKPLHPNQHAYQTGKSVDTALYQLMARFEKALDQRKLALGIFLDIEGAFNSTSYDSMCVALARHGVDHTIIRWIRATLEGRQATATLGVTSVSVMVSTRRCVGTSPMVPCCQWIAGEALWGSWCPQSVHKEVCCHLSHGALSMNCWRGCEGGVYAQGYADDICLLAVGKFPNTVLGLTQWAIHTVEAWCSGQSLSINPDKTGLIAFTRKKKLAGFFEPRIFGRTLQCSTSVKYLGVILDSRLTWSNMRMLRSERPKICCGPVGGPVGPETLGGSLALRLCH